MWWWKRCGGSDTSSKHLVVRLRVVIEFANDGNAVSLAFAHQLKPLCCVGHLLLNFAGKDDKVVVAEILPVLLTVATQPEAGIIIEKKLRWVCHSAKSTRASHRERGLLENTVFKCIIRSQFLFKNS